MAIQISTDTELSAVNSILGSIGQSPVTNITGDALLNPEIAFVVNLLGEVNKDVQSIGWTFNSEYHVKKSPDANGNYPVPANAIMYDISDGQVDRQTNVVQRDGKMYDIIRQSDVFTTDYYFDSVVLLPFTDVPSPIQRYIIARASMRAATQIVSNADLVKLLQVEEAQARANAMEFETEQGDHNFMGFPDDTRYRAYQPYKALIR